MGKNRQAVTLLEHSGIVRRQHVEEVAIDQRNNVLLNP